MARPSLVVGRPESPDSPSPQQPALISSFNPAEFPEVRATPEGQTDGQDSRGTAEGSGGCGLTEETPGVWG